MYSTPCVKQKRRKRKENDSRREGNNKRKKEQRNTGKPKNLLNNMALLHSLSVHSSYFLLRLQWERYAP